MTMNIVSGNDASNALSGSAGDDLIYGFDPNAAYATANIAATRVAAGLTGALFATAAPGDLSRLFIVQQSGVIKILDLTTGSLLPTPFASINVDSSGERGLLGMAFDPNFATNGFFYVYRTVTAGGAHNEVVRYHVSTSNPNITDGTVTPIISLPNLS